MSDKIKKEETNKTTEASSSPDDQDLDALLNSALDDFDKPPPGGEVATTDPGTVGEVVTSEDTEVVDPGWTEEFIRQAAAQFEQNMQSLMTQAQGGNMMEGLADLRPDQLGENFQRIAEAAARAIEEEGSDGDFSAAISQTLRNLSESAETLQNPASDEDFVNMFGGLNLGDGSEGADFLPFVQNMMQSLLSKEVLYPALKDIVDKYPGWLEEKGSTLSAADLERFTKQKDLMTQVCAELESEAPEDPGDARQGRFNRVLELMQKMQDCGQPPADLVGDLGSVVSFDQQGNPTLPGLNLPGGADPANCSLM